MNKKKYILTLVIVLLFVVLLVAGGTYAYWTWNSTVNKDVVFNTSKSIAEYVIYDEGDSRFIGDFQPKSTFCQSTSNTLSFYKTSEVANVGLVATINMDVNFVGPNIAQSDSVYWVLTSGDNTISCSDGLSSSQVINYGTFNGINNGQSIILESDIEITTSEQKFTVWIWIDSAGSNLGSLSNETVDVNIWTRIDMLDNSPKPEPNAPVLDEGMIPVTIANDGTVTTIAENDSSWYNYGNKEWANTVLVDADSRSTYKGTTGKTINQDDILAYYVWIPRYSYRIPEMVCSEIANPNEEEHIGCYKYTLSSEDKTTFINWWYSYINDRYDIYGIEYALESATEDVETMLITGYTYIDVSGHSDYYGDVNFHHIYEFYNMISYYNTNNEPDISYESIFIPNNNPLINFARPIDISFESKNAIVLMGDAVHSYRTHPAFVFGDETVSGIWVGKFESTGNETTPTILPNTTPLIPQDISTQFVISLKFAGGTQSGSSVLFTGNNTYGLTTNTDSHMMKNSEWGAVAYLSHSNYGINSEIRINNYYNNGYYKTGCGASVEDDYQTDTCQIMYAGATSYPQSTTGNITGVFDISGGTWELVMGNYNDTISDASGFTVLPPSKYYDKYTTNNELTACNGGLCYGHALSETLGWYGDYFVFVRENRPWFQRGGATYSDQNAGAWNAGANSGYTYEEGSFRSVLVID